MILIVGGLMVVNERLYPCMVKREDEAVKRAFGKRVRALRREKGLSQEGLALNCNLDRTYIGGVERGERNVSLISIRKIAIGLGVSLRDLF